MKKALVLLTVVSLATAASALTVTYDWENGGTALGTYGNIVSVSNSTDQALSGSASLKIVEEAASSDTPQAYLGWITGLNAGDQVTAGFWVYDVVSSSPSGRIWGHYTNSDVLSFAGSAGGNNTYSSDTGWSYLEHTWTFDPSTDRNGIVVEVRVYGANDAVEDTIYVDDITITAPDYATIVTPVPEPATMALLGLGGLLLARRKK